MLEDGHCYLWGDKMLSWDAAEEFCQKEGGHLASVTSESTNDYISKEKSRHLWIGGSDKENEGTWKWTDGSAWNFTKWNKGQPSNGSDEDDEDCLQYFWHAKQLHSEHL